MNKAKKLCAYVLIITIINSTCLAPMMVFGKQPLPPPGDPYCVKINFHKPGSPTPEGYFADQGEQFKSALGLKKGYEFGWNVNHTNMTRYRKLHPDLRLDTLCLFKEGGYWELVLPNGRYEVTVSVGDPAEASIHTINVEGVSYWSKIKLEANKFLRDTRTVTVADGRLTVDQGDLKDGMTRINYIEIRGAAANTPPRITSTPIRTAEEGKTYTYDVQADDPDGDMLCYSLAESPWRMSIDADTGLISWTPTKIDAGKHTVTVEVTDSRGGKDVQTFTVEVAEGVNSPPVIVTTPVIAGTEGVPYAYDVNALDADKDPLAYSLLNHPETMAIDAQTGLITWTPGSTQAGAHQVVVQVSDGRGGSDLQEYTLTILEALNNPPHIISEPVMTAGENESYTYDVQAEDPDNDGLAFTLTSYPQGMTIDAATGVISWTPASGQIGDNPVTVEVSDGRGGRDTQSFTVTVLRLYAVVPDLIGLSQAQAEAALAGAGLRAGNVTSDYSDTIPVGCVASQNPVAGSCVRLDTLVDVVISLGRSAVDLIPAKIDVSGTTVDPQTLLFGGTIQVTIVNQGTTPCSQDFAVTLFEDTDHDGAFAQSDKILGSGAATGGLAAGGSAILAVAVQGQVQFRENLIYAFIDSGNVVKETNEDNNIAHHRVNCEYKPPVGQFNPVLEWEWTGSSVKPSSNQVMCAPMVGNLNDDNQDGLVDLDDIPDIVFNTYIWTDYLANGTLRAISGDGSKELFSITAYDTMPGCAPALGDIDNDGLLEVLAISEPQSTDKTYYKVYAFENNGALKWASGLLNLDYFGISSVALADLNQDGATEIIVGRIVLDNKGKTLWAGTGGRGANNACVANLDLDGYPEVIAGNTAYHYDGSIYWRNTTVGDGLTAVANFDQDPYPEIVLVSGGYVYLLEHDGTKKWGPLDLPPPGISHDQGGPPTIADFDGDGAPEIGVAGGYRYVVFEGNGTVKWSSPTSDYSSNVTGSSVFDFEGDGSAEVIYSDEHYLRIYRGLDGAVLFSTYIASWTLLEYPLVVDVDNDNNAEIVVPSNNFYTGGKTGIQVFGDANDTWVNTRKIWNQHSYHITNIEDDGTIPRIEPNNWDIYNNYRQNQMLKPFGCIDLTASYLRMDVTNCPTSVDIIARVGNGGNQHVAPGLTVAFYDGDPGIGGSLLGVVTLTERLDPGRYVDVKLTWKNPRLGLRDICVVADDNGAGRDKISENNEENNKAFASFVVAVNQSPRISSDPIATGVEGQPYQYRVTASDPDGDPLTYRLTAYPAGMTADAETGVLNWTPGGTQAGVHEVTIQVTDGRGGRDEQSYQVTVAEAINTDPVITSMPPLTGAEGQAYAYDVEATDGDHDPLAFSLLLSPAGMTIDQVTGAVAWTPTATQSGRYEVLVRAADNRGGTGKQLFFIDVAEALNVPPVVTSEPVLYGARNEPYLYDVDAVDADHDGLTYALRVHPEGMGIDEATGAVRWTPSETQVGAHTVEIEVTDGRGGSAQQGFILTVLACKNNPPVISSVPPAVAVQGRDYVYQAAAMDQDGDAIRYTLASAPNGMTISEDGRITWPDDGRRPVSAMATLCVTDERGGRTLQSWNIKLVETEPALSVKVEAAPNPARVGDILAITVGVTSARTINALTLTYDGAALSLDAAGRAYHPAAQAGFHKLEAMAVDETGQVAKSSLLVAVRDDSDTAGPEIALNVPDCQRVTEPYTVVGSIADVSSMYYQLQTREKGSTAWQTLAEGYGLSVTGALGVLDPTLLRNGVHEIRLHAKDPIGNSSEATAAVIVEGGLKAGALNFATVDMNYPAPGMPLQLVRTYDSRAGGGEFGPGWNLAAGDVALNTTTPIGEGWDQIVKPLPFYDTFYLVEKKKHFIVIRYSDTEMDKFAVDVYPKKTDVLPIDFVGISFKPVEGTQGKLEILDEEPYAIYCWDGTLMSYEWEVYNPRRFRVTRRDGTAYVINTATGLESVTDPNGHKITYSRDGIHHSSGVSLTFERGAGDRIERVTDPAGRQIEYRYDLDGNLAQVVEIGGGLPGERQIGAYAYLERLQGRKLQAIKAPDGQALGSFEYDASGRMTALIDADGNRVIFGYDLPNHRQTITDRNGNAILYEFDGRGNVTKRTDPLGNITAWEYDALDRMVKETGPDGSITRKSYNAAGDVLTETDPLGHVTANTYDAKGNVLTTKDPNGNITTYAYDVKGNLTSICDALGNASTLNYGTAGELLSFADPLGNNYGFTYDQITGLPSITTMPDGSTVTYTYDAYGNATSETRSWTDQNGVVHAQTVSYEYDAAGRVTKRTNPDGTNTRTVYDAKGLKVRDIDAAGRITSYQYDADGRLTRVDYPDGTWETNEYDANGNRTTAIDRGGRRTQYVYDALNRQVRTVYPDNTSTSTEYDAQGRVRARTDQRGYTTRQEYDLAGRLVKIFDPLGHVTEYAYDAAGNQIAVKDPLGNTTSFTYDAANRLTKTTFADGTSVSYVYDAVGRRTAQIDQNGYETKYAYDAIGRLISVTDALGNETSYEYNGDGRMTAQIDALGRKTGFLYDVMGRLLEKTLPMGQRETYAYNPDGLLATKTDFNGHMTTYAYDPNSLQLLSKTYGDGTRISYSYYPDGRLKTATAPGGLTNSYEYDVMGRLAKVVNPYGQAIEYRYDEAGNRTQIIAPHGTVTYEYNPMNQISTVIDQSGKVTSYEYDAANRLSRTLLGNGTETVYTYDTLGRLLELVNRKPGGAIITSHKYTLDAAGHRIRIDEHDSTVDYGYDKLYRLVSEHRSRGIRYDAAYTYDAVGNRLTKTATDGSWTYAYDENDRLLSDGKYTYQWDNAGRLIGKVGPEGMTSYTYNPEDRLVEMSGPDGCARFTYDASGNRIGRTTATGTTSWLIDPNIPYAQVLEETVGGATKVFAYGNDLLNVDGPDGARWFAYDGLGSTRALTDANGAITDSYTFEAFGGTIGRTGSTANEFLFTGEQFDPTLASYYLRARYYSPEIGRFMQRDPWADDLGNTVNLPKYTYASGNPVNFSDPNGYFTLGEKITVLTVLTILTNASISTWSASTIAKTGFKIDGFMLSVRGNGFITGGTYGAGADVIYDMKTSEFWVSLAVEGGLDPLSLFKGQKQAGFSATLGVIFNMQDPNQMSGAGVLAAWPISVMKLLSLIPLGRRGAWGAMTQFAKNAKHGKGWTIGFGKSFSEPAFIVVGPSARQFSSVFSYNTNYASMSSLLSGVKDFITPIVNFMKNSIINTTDYDSFCENADQILSSLVNFSL